MQPTKRPRNLRRAPLNHEPAHLAFLLRDRGGQAAAARAIGKAPSVINEYCKGTRSMPQDVLLEVAAYLGCPPSLLERRVRVYAEDAA